jgi:UDP-N-acetylmuramate: L-alanyl-gamma-D-glutamyl-meso-diaminopimelate ligase
MRVHFIAIGGSAMHNLAIALSRKGIEVTGSDDEIFEPSRSRLLNEKLLPNQLGWHPELIHSGLDAVILGMHARIDNLELLKAKELGIPIYSYPEYLYEQSKNKKRLVIGGSHGKTTITSMILHACAVLKVEIDYMVGAQLEGYDCMVKLTETAPFVVLEGDEYLSSPIDRRPKFHLYKPDVALLSGIAWDHINVFPTFENYVEQFRIFCYQIKVNGTLIYNEEDQENVNLVNELKNSINLTPYITPNYYVNQEGTLLEVDGKQYQLQIFGAHNLQNLIGAMHICSHMGISQIDFLTAMSSFSGAGKRLQKVVERADFIMFKDFAHSPSKLKATSSAVKEQFPDRTLLACMELHTFSSLKSEFLVQYKDSMSKADIAVVYFSPEVVAHKNLKPISVHEVSSAFGENVKVVCTRDDVLEIIYRQGSKNTALLMMSSGNFDGIDFDELGKKMLEK